MTTMKAIDVEETKVGAVPYKGESFYAKDVSVRWLSKVGRDAQGAPSAGGGAARAFQVLAPSARTPHHLSRGVCIVVMGVSGFFKRARARVSSLREGRVRDRGQRSRV